MKSKTILSFLLFFLVLSACQKKELNNEEKKILTEWIPAFQKNKALSGITETERLAYCFEENQSRSSNEVKRVYPRYLGGYYRCANNGKIVVSLTDTSQIIKDDIIRLCSLTPENITFKLCEYSLNEIFNLQKQISEIPDVFEKWNIMTVGNDLEKNRVMIRFYGKYDENKINSFKKEISDSPMIDFWFLDDELPEPLDSLAPPCIKGKGIIKFFL